MNGKKYIIRWRSKVNGRIGQGSRQFERHEAEELITELNAEFPDIVHEVIEAPANQPADEEQTRRAEHALTE